MSIFYQQTIYNSISCSGVAIHSGEITEITLHPAPVDTGIVFRRTDLDSKEEILAEYKNVTATDLGTTISNKNGASVAVVEHLMSALWGTGIDNCYIDVTSTEVPVLDGSSEPFLFLVECAGVKKQDKPRKFVKILKKVVAEENGSSSILEADSHFNINFSIDFENEMIGKQNYHFVGDSCNFKINIARARTFGMESEVELMRSKGLAKGGSLDNAIVVSEDEVLNNSGLRFDDEFVRHKILDSIGDLYLSGHYIIGKFTGHKSGHALNNQLLHKVFADDSNWCYVDSL